MHFSPIQWITWIAVPLMQVLLLGILINRKVRTPLPKFFNYMVFSIVANVAVLTLSPKISPVQYFYLYWTINALNSILAFAVIYEVFINILKPYTALIDFSKMLFWWAAGFLLLASSLTAFASSGTTTSAKICAAIWLVERIVQLMQCGLLLLLLIFESRLGLSWRSHGMSVALGMGLYAALNTGLTVLQDRFVAWQGQLNLINTILGLGIIVIWQVNFFLPEPQRRTAQDTPTKLIFQRWNNVLSGIQAGEMAFASPTDSFIPGVEKAVERVLARKMVQ